MRSQILEKLNFLKDCPSARAFCQVILVVSVWNLVALVLTQVCNASWNSPAVYTWSVTFMMTMHLPGFYLFPLILQLDKKKATQNLALLRSNLFKREYWKFVGFHGSLWFANFGTSAMAFVDPDYPVWLATAAQQLCIVFSALITVARARSMKALSILNWLGVLILLFSVFGMLFIKEMVIPANQQCGDDNSIKQTSIKDILSKMLKAPFVWGVLSGFLTSVRCEVQATMKTSMPISLFLGGMGLGACSLCSLMLAVMFILGLDLQSSDHSSHNISVTVRIKVLGLFCLLGIGVALMAALFLHSLRLTNAFVVSSGLAFWVPISMGLGVLLCDLSGILPFSEPTMPGWSHWFIPCLVGLVVGCLLSNIDKNASLKKNNSNKDACDDGECANEICDEADSFKDSCSPPPALCSESTLEQGELDKMAGDIELAQ